MPVVGTGITITFQSGFFAEILNVSDNEMMRARIDATHMGSNDMEYLPGSLPDWGTLEVEMAFDPDIKPPLEAAAETITVTYPKGATTQASWARTGFLERFQYTGPLEDRMTATATIKFTGDLTVTPSV